MSQFGGMSMSGANMAGATGLGATQLPLGGAQFYYNPVDNTFLAAPPMYSAQPLAATQPADGAYNSYAAPMPYYTPGAYPSYLPAMPYMPYTPSRVSAGYPELYKEVPGLENRRGSYSTNESAPGTPNYGTISQREQGTQIVAGDRSPFGSTPSQAIATSTFVVFIQIPTMRLLLHMLLDLVKLRHRRPLSTPALEPARGSGLPSISLFVTRSSAFVDSTSLAMKSDLLGYHTMHLMRSANILTMHRSRSIPVSRRREMSSRLTSMSLTFPR